MSMIIQTLADNLSGIRPLAAGRNPFDGIVPNFAIAGADFNSWWKKLLGGAWGLSIVYCAFKLFPAALSMHRSRSVGNVASLGEASQDLKFWGLGTGVVIAAGLIFGTMLSVAGT